MTHTRHHVVRWYGTDGNYTWTWHGRPPRNREELLEYVRRYIESYKPGGKNHHVTKVIGFIPSPRLVQVVKKRTEQIVQEWEADVVTLL